MLPFPVMNQYGNVVIKDKIKKYVGGNNFYLALSDTGNLYSYGNNTYGQLGLGDTTQRTQWVLSATEVDDVFLNRNSNTNTTIIRKGNDLLYAGSGAPIVGDSSWKGQSTVFNKFRDISTIAGDGSTVIDIQSTTNSLGILMSDKNLYMTGTNAGTSGTSTGLRLSSSNVDSFSISSYNTYIVRAGELLGTGNNTYYQIATTGTTSYSTYISITSSVRYVLAGIYNVYIVLNNGEIWGRGSNSLMSLGLSGSTDNRVLTKLMNVLIPQNVYIHCYGYGAAILTEDGIYACGQTYYAGSGSSGQTVWTNFLPQQAISGVVMDLTGTGNSTVLHTTTGIYGAGSDILVKPSNVKYSLLTSPI